MYPTRVWELTRTYNSVDYVNAIMVFLELPETDVDAGFSLSLKRRAQSLVSERVACEFVASDAVQKELNALLESGLATSLDVDRRHAQNKVNESRKIVV